MEPQPIRVEAPFFWSDRMSGQLAISIGQHSDKGRKETNQDFHGALIPEEPLLEPERHRHRPGGRNQQQRRQRRSPASSAVKSFLTDYYCTSEIMVGQNVGAARHRSDELLAALANPAKPIPVRQGPGLCVHAQRHGHQVQRPRTFSTSAMPASTGSPAMPSNS